MGGLEGRLNALIEASAHAETKLMLDRLRTAYSGAIAAEDGWLAYLRSGLPGKRPGSSATATIDNAVVMLRERIAKFESIEKMEAFIKRIDEDQNARSLRKRRVGQRKSILPRGFY